LSHFGGKSRTRQAAVILGAGATRGASFVDASSTILPPLDADFFQQVSRLDQDGTARRLLGFLRDEYGHELGISMERFFSEADYTDRFHSELSVDPGPTVKRYRKALTDFHQVLPRLLRVAANAECDHHGVLASLLDAQDCVISFNYDCVVDIALRQRAGKRWDPAKGGYGFVPGAGSELWKQHLRGRAVQGTIRLLKMHGSLNWRPSSAGRISLIQPAQLSSTADVIIPRRGSRI